MPYGNPGGYRNKNRNGRGRGGRGGGSNAALVTALQSVLARFGGVRRQARPGKLGAQRARPARVFDDAGREFEELDYQDRGRGPLRVGHRM